MRTVSTKIKEPRTRSIRCAVDLPHGHSVSDCPGQSAAVDADYCLPHNGTSGAGLFSLCGRRFGDGRAANRSLSNAH